MGLLFILIIALLIFAPDTYIWSQFIKGGTTMRTVLYFLPTILTLGSIVLLSVAEYRNEALRWVFLFMLLFVLPKFFFAVFSVLGKLVSLLIPQSVVIGNVLGILVGVFFFFIAITGISWGWKHIVVKERAVEFSNLPASFDGFKIVQLSDFHIGTYRNSTETVQEIVKKVNDQHPDLIVFTGDLINGHPSELDPFMEILPLLKSKHGVLAIMGNHDYCMFHRYDSPEENVKAIQELQRRERSFGWHLLLNEHTFIHEGPDSIAIIGVENDSKPPLPQKGDLRKASKGLAEETFKVLLSHDPSHWHREVLPTSNINLTLSGHTHAMQFKLLGFSPASWGFAEWGGLYSSAERMLHVSTGNGSNVPFRFGAWPEIDVLILKQKIMESSAMSRITGR